MFVYGFVINAVNRLQKYLTAVCLALFLGSLWLCPWDGAGISPLERWNGFSTIYSPPYSGCKINFQILGTEWFALAIIYAALFFILKIKK